MYAPHCGAATAHEPHVPLLHGAPFAQGPASFWLPQLSLYGPHSGRIPLQIWTHVPFWHVYGFGQVDPGYELPHESENGPHAGGFAVQFPGQVPFTHGPCAQYAYFWLPHESEYGPHSGGNAVQTCSH